MSAPQVARSSAAPDPLAACRNTGSRRGGDQPRPAPPLPDEGAALRPPSLWGQEETLGRTGVWCGLPADAGWQPSPLGGSHVRRALRLYAADSYRMGGSASDCNKWQRSSMQLIPGYMLVWCACCGFCIMFAIKRDAESPRTVFDLLFTHMEQPLQQFQLDNGCNLHNFALAREPEHFRDMRVLVDELHYRGHTNCSQGYNTGAGLQKPLDCGIIPSLVLTVLHVHHVIECLARCRNAAGADAHIDVYLMQHTTQASQTHPWRSRRTRCCGGSRASWRTWTS